MSRFLSTYGSQIGEHYTEISKIQGGYPCLLKTYGELGSLCLSMLKLNPDDRLSLSQCLRLPIFDEYRIPKPSLFIRLLNIITLSTPDPSPTDEDEEDDPHSDSNMDSDTDSSLDEDIIVDDIESKWIVKCTSMYPPQPQYKSIHERILHLLFHDMGTLESVDHSYASAIAETLNSANHNLIVPLD